MAEGRTPRGPDDNGGAEGEALLARYDWKNDAFGGPPFVPQPEAAEFLMALGLRTGTPLALKAALRSLAVLAKSDIADPVEGGFFERCDGPRWTRPHTRKTLEGNAALLHAVATAGAWTQDAALLTAAAGTAAFIDAALKEQGSELWVASQGPDDEYFERMAHGRARRGVPERGNRAGIGANALAISALVRAGLALDEPRWIARARLAGRELREVRNSEERGTDEIPCGIAYLDLELATGDREWGTLAWPHLRLDPDAYPQGLSWRGTEGLAASLAVAIWRGGSPFVAGREGTDRELRERLLSRFVPSDGDIGGIARVGLAKLVFQSTALEVKWTGPSPVAREAKLVRAALAAASASGPFRAAGEDTAGDGSSVASVRFGAGEKAAGPTSDPADVKPMLVGILGLTEAI